MCLLTLTSLGVFAKLYEVTKGERNKYLSLIHISNQNLAEVQEKLAKLEDNLQTLQLIAINKDKYMLSRYMLYLVYLNFFFFTNYTIR